MPDIKEMQDKANDVDRTYRPNANWSLREYAEGMVGDVGDLLKLVMAKEGLRSGDNIDESLEHEVNDIQWSLLMLYRELGLDPAESFLRAMDTLQKRIAEEQN